MAEKSLLVSAVQSSDYNLQVYEIVDEITEFHTIPHLQNISKDQFSHLEENPIETFECFTDRRKV